MSQRAEELAMPPTSTVNDFAARGLGNIPEVRRIYTARQDCAFFVRVLVSDDRDKGVRRRIYAKELEMINEFKLFDFDFDILTTELTDPSFCLAYEKKASRVELT